MYIKEHPICDTPVIHRYTLVSLFNICQIILFSYNLNVDKSHIRANYSLMEYYIT